MAHVNVALIGYAFMGRAHSNAWRQVSRFFSTSLTPRMKVICGRDPKNVKAAAAQLGWEESATDWRDVIARPDIDIVDIATPGDSHAEIAIAAAKAGKVVFCEKPLANTVKEAEQMLAAVTKAGVIHMICHNYRKAPAVTLAKQIIDEGRLGRLYHFRGTYLQDWVADPKVPLVLAAAERKGRLWRARRHRLALARPGALSRRACDGSHRGARDVREGTSAARQSEEEGSRDGRRCLGVHRALRERRARHDRSEPVRDGTKELQPLRDQRQQGLHRVQPGTDERARRLLHRRTRSACRASTTSWSPSPSIRTSRRGGPPGHIIGYEHTFIHTVYDLLEAMAKDKLPSPNFEDGVQKSESARGHGEIGRGEEVGQGLNDGLRACRLQAPGSCEELRAKCGWRLEPWSQEP